MLQEKLSALKREHPSLQKHEVYELFFFFLCVIFPSWIRIHNTASDLYCLIFVIRSYLDKAKFVKQKYQLFSSQQACAPWLLWMAGVWRLSVYFRVSVYKGHLTLNKLYLSTRGDATNAFFISFSVKFWWNSWCEIMICCFMGQIFAARSPTHWEMR